MTSDAPSIVLVAALAANRCIGVNNAMPWHIPEDFNHFKKMTLGKPCIMGRKTFESIVEQLGKPLPGRRNMVISRGGFQHEGAETYTSLEEALKAASGPEISIIGGAQVYAQALPYATALELTHIYKVVEGDAFFPEINPAEWLEVRREERPGDPPAIPPFSFVRYERRAAL
jgi:dihydrofolate reductase